MRDKPPSQLIKAGGGKRNTVILGPLGARLAVRRDWGFRSTTGGLHPSTLSPSSLRELGGHGRQRLP